MNMNEVKALSNKEIDIKVAELCGWTEIGMFNGCLSGTVNGIHHCELYEYHQDLNAMAKAQTYLKGQVKNSDLWMDELYVRNLVDVIGCLPLSRTHLVKATARQKAEAFILTMGKQ